MDISLTRNPLRGDAAYEILGEAARHLPEPLKAANPDIPWTTMAAVRNRIVRGYFGIDHSILFTTIEEDLKPLLPRLGAWRARMGLLRKKP